MAWSTGTESSCRRWLGVPEELREAPHRRPVSLTRSSINGISSRGDEKSRAGQRGYDADPLEAHDLDQPCPSPASGGERPICGNDYSDIVPSAKTSLLGQWWAMRNGTADISGSPGNQESATCRLEMGPLRSNPTLTASLELIA